MNKNKSAELLSKAITNKGIIATTQLIECLVAFLPNSEKAHWRPLIKLGLTGKLYVDTLVSAERLNSTHHRLLRVSDDSANIYIDSDGKVTIQPK